MTTDTTTDLEIKTTIIGTIDNGCDGAQQYILLTCLNDVLSKKQAFDWLAPQVYRYMSTPSGYFCSYIGDTIKKSHNEVICIVRLEYDN